MAVRPMQSGLSGDSGFHSSRRTPGLFCPTLLFDLSSSPPRSHPKAAVTERARYRRSGFTLPYDLGEADLDFARTLHV